jgi:hypothetical protein
MRLRSVLILLVLGTTWRAVADTTATVPPKNAVFVAIPGSLGYERQLPFSFSAAVRLGLTITWLADRDTGISFHQENWFEACLLYNIHIKGFTLSPAIGLAANSQSAVNYTNLFLSATVRYQFSLLPFLTVSPGVDFFRLHPTTHGVAANVLTNPMVRFDYLF